MRASRLSTAQTVCLALFLPLTTAAQQPQQAVAYVARVFKPNALLAKGHQLSSTGSWAATAKPTLALRPACTASGAACLEVIYRVPQDHVECRWLLLFPTAQATQPIVLDENDDARQYTMRQSFPAGTSTTSPKLRIGVYPALAEAAHIQGTVQIEVIWDSAGNPVYVKQLNGPSMLVGAALDDARRMKIEPMMVGDKPIVCSGLMNYTFNTNGPHTSSVTVSFGFTPDDSTLK